MGRFDALTKIDEKTPPTKKGDMAPVANELESEAVSNELAESAFFQPRNQPSLKKPANPQTGKTTQQSPTPSALEKPEKYTTRLQPSLVKKLKLHAVEKDLNDYDVLRIALLEYFEKNK